MESVCEVYPVMHVRAHDYLSDYVRGVTRFVAPHSLGLPLKMASNMPSSQSVT